jgi:hypothetical protein
MLILVLPIRTEDHSGGARGFTVSKSKIVGDGKQGAPIVCSATAEANRHRRIMIEIAAGAPFLNSLAYDHEGAIGFVKRL